MPPNRLSFREVKRRLEAAGFRAISQKGSHIKFVRFDEEGVAVVMVPRHRTVQIGTLKSILRQAHLEWSAFEEL